MSGRSARASRTVLESRGAAASPTGSRHTVDKTDLYTEDHSDFGRPLRIGVVVPNAAPGWYPDDANNVQRFWDGTGWTDHTQPMYASPPGQQNTTQLPRVAHPDTRPWWKKKRFAIPGGVLSGFVILIVLIAVFVPASKTTPTAETTSQLPTVTRSHSAERSTSVTNSTHAKQPTSIASSAPTSRPTPRHTKAKKHHKAHSPAGDGSFVMPNEVGDGLQAAQDDIQRVSGDPVFFSHSHDLLGDRFQIFDRDWQVCTQNILAGTTVSAVGHIDFGVVKIYETCP